MFLSPINKHSLIPSLCEISCFIFYVFYISLYYPGRNGWSNEKSNRLRNLKDSYLISSNIGLILLIIKRKRKRNVSYNSTLKFAQTAKWCFQLLLSIEVQKRCLTWGRKEVMEACVSHSMCGGMGLVTVTMGTYLIIVLSQSNYNSNLIINIPD